MEDITVQSSLERFHVLESIFSKTRQKINIFYEELSENIFGIISTELDYVAEHLNHLKNITQYLELKKQPIDEVNSFHKIELSKLRDLITSILCTRLKSLEIDQTIKSTLCDFLIELQKEIIKQLGVLQPELLQSEVTLSSEQLWQEQKKFDVANNLTHSDALDDFVILLKNIRTIALERRWQFPKLYLFTADSISQYDSECNQVVQYIRILRLQLALCGITTVTSLDYYDSTVSLNTHLDDIESCSACVLFGTPSVGMLERKPNQVLHVFLNAIRKNIANKSDFLIMPILLRGNHFSAFPSDFSPFTYGKIHDVRPQYYLGTYTDHLQGLIHILLKVDYCSAYENLWLMFHKKHYASLYPRKSHDTEKKLESAQVYHRPLVPNFRDWIACKREYTGEDVDLVLAAELTKRGWFFSGDGYRLISKHGSFRKKSGRTCEVFLLPHVDTAALALPINYFFDKSLQTNSVAQALKKILDTDFNSLDNLSVADLKCVLTELIEDDNAQIVERVVYILKECNHDKDKFKIYTEKYFAQHEGKDVFDELIPLLDEREDVELKILFPFNVTNLHWLHVEIQVTKCGSDINIRIYAHNPYGSCSLMEYGNNSRIITETFKKRLATITTQKMKIQVTTCESPYRTSRQNINDKTSCGAVMIEDILLNIMDQTLNRTLHEVGARDLRFEQLQTVTSHVQDLQSVQKFLSNNLSSIKLNSSSKIAYPISINEDQCKFSLYKAVQEQQNKIPKVPSLEDITSDQFLNNLYAENSLGITFQQGDTKPEINRNKYENKYIEVECVPNLPKMCDEFVALKEEADQQHRTGRLNYVNMIAQQLAVTGIATLTNFSHKPTQPLVTSAVCGIGGIGKTELAKKYGWDNVNDYKLVRFFDASKDLLIQFHQFAWDAFKIQSNEPREDMESLLQTSIDVKGLSMNDYQLRQQALAIVEAVYKKLGLVQNWLLIFDDAPSKEEISLFLPESYQYHLGQGKNQITGHVVITTKNNSWPNSIVVSGLTDAEIVNLFHAKFGNSIPLDLQLKLAQKLGFHPLALLQAISHIKNNDDEYELDKRIENYISLLEQPNIQKFTELFSKNDIENAMYHRAVIPSIKLSIEQFEKNVTKNALVTLDEIKMLLSMAAHLSLAIPRDLFVSLVKFTVKDDEHKVTAIINLLKSHLIISVDAKLQMINLHQLMQLTLRCHLIDYKSPALSTLILFFKDEFTIDSYDPNGSLNPKNIDRIPCAKEIITHADLDGIFNLELLLIKLSYATYYSYHRSNPTLVCSLLSHVITQIESMGNKRHELKPVIVGHCYRIYGMANCSMNPERAKVYLLKCFEHYQDSTEKLQTIAGLSALRSLAYVETNLGFYHSAHQYLSQCSLFFEQLPRVDRERYKLERIELFHNQANYAYQVGDEKKTITLLKRALIEYDSMGDLLYYPKLDLLRSLGFVSSQLQDFSNSMTYFQAAFNFSKMIEGVTLQSISDLFSVAEQYQKLNDMAKQNFLHDYIFKLSLKNSFVFHEIKPTTGENILLLSARFGHFLLTRWLVDNFPSLVQSKDKYGRSVWHYGCMSDCLEQVDYLWQLCESNPNIEKLDYEGNDGLLIACMMGSFSTVQHLHEQLHLAVDVINKHGRTALHSACSSPKIDLIEWLIKKGLKINVIDNFGVTPAMLAVKRGNTQLIECLISMGYDFDLRDQSSNSLLHYIGYSDNYLILGVAMTQMTSDSLLEPNKHGVTPLMLSARQGNAKQFFAMLGYVSDPLKLDNELIRQLLDNAISSNQVEIALQLIQEYPKSLPKDYEGTPFLYVISQGCLPLAEMLLKMDYKYLQERTEHGYNALHIAIFKDQKQIINWLHSIDSSMIKQTTRYGEDALMLAGYINSYELFDFILMLNPEMNARNQFGFGAIEILYLLKRRESITELSCRGLYDDGAVFDWVDPDKMFQFWDALLNDPYKHHITNLEDVFDYFMRYLPKKTFEVSLHQWLSIPGKRKAVLLALDKFDDILNNVTGEINDILTSGDSSEILIAIHILTNNKITRGDTVKQIFGLLTHPNSHVVIQSIKYFVVTQEACDGLMAVYDELIVHGSDDVRLAALLAKRSVVGNLGLAMSNTYEKSSFNQVFFEVNDVINNYIIIEPNQRQELFSKKVESKRKFLKQGDVLIVKNQEGFVLYAKTSIIELKCFINKDSEFYSVMNQITIDHSDDCISSRLVEFINQNQIFHPDNINWDSMNDNLYTRINAEINLNSFSKSLGMSDLSYDENRTCILGIDGEFSIHITLEHNSGLLYVYSPLFDGLPESIQTQLELFSFLLRISLLGAGTNDCGIGVSAKNELCLIHTTIPMLNAYPVALEQCAVWFVALVESLRAQLKHYLKSSEFSVSSQNIKAYNDKILVDKFNSHYQRIYSITDYRRDTRHLSAPPSTNSLSKKLQICAENANQYLNAFAQLVGISGIKFDENNTCILSVDDKFGLHFTYEPISAKLYCYTAIASSLPAALFERYQFYLKLLEGAVLSGEFGGARIGCAEHEGLILMHNSFNLLELDLKKFITQISLFVQVSEEWIAYTQSIGLGIDQDQDVDLEELKPFVNLHRPGIIQDIKTIQQFVEFCIKERHEFPLEIILDYLLNSKPAPDIVLLFIQYWCLKNKIELAFKLIAGYAMKAGYGDLEEQSSGYISELIKTQEEASKAIVVQQQRIAVTNNVNDQALAKIRTAINHMRLQEYDTALSILLSLNEERIYLPQVKFQLAKCYLYTGNYDRATALINESIKLKDVPEARDLSEKIKLHRGIKKVLDKLVAKIMGSENQNVGMNSVADLLSQLPSPKLLSNPKDLRLQQEIESNWQNYQWFNSHYWQSHRPMSMTVFDPMISDLGHCKNLREQVLLLCPVQISLSQSSDHCHEFMSAIDCFILQVQMSVIQSLDIDLVTHLEEDQELFAAIPAINFDFPQLAPKNDAVISFVAFENNTNQRDFGVWYHQALMPILLFTNKANPSYFCYFAHSQDLIQGEISYQRHCRAVLRYAGRHPEKLCFMLSVEPGVGQRHYIVTIVYQKRLYLINPVGLSKRKDMFLALKELKDSEHLEVISLYHSNTPLQHDPNQSIVSCGPICVELIRVLRDKTQLIDQLSTCMNDALCVHEITGLEYVTFDVVNLLTDSELFLLPFSIDQEYTDTLCNIRDRHCLLLSELNQYQVDTAREQDHAREVREEVFVKENYSDDDSLEEITKNGFSL